MAIQTLVSLTTLALISFLLLSSPVTEATRDIKTNTLVATTCNKTPYPQVCISALESDPRSATAADLPALCRISVDVMAARVKEAFTITSVAANNQTNYESWGRAAACMWDMKVSNQTMAEKAVPAAAGGDFQAVYNAVSSVKSDATDCNQQFPEMSERSTLLIQLVDDTMTMLHLLF